jgi:bifunctional non-homologous end joining protein LigD
VVLDAKGNPSPGAAGAFDSSKTNDIVYFVFDLPYFGGHDLRRVPLVERRKLWKAILDKAPHSERIRFRRRFRRAGGGFEARARRTEGLIGKRADAPYGVTRSPSWVKPGARGAGVRDPGIHRPEGRAGGFGSLLLGIHDSKGNLAYAGNVGTGFDDALLRSLLAKLKAIEVDKPPVSPAAARGEGIARWPGSSRRWPSPSGPPTGASATRSSPPVAKRQGSAGDHAGKAGEARRRKAAKPPRRRDQIRTPIASSIRSPGQPLDLAGYYERIADRMLPHLEGGPSRWCARPRASAGALQPARRSRSPAFANRPTV